MVEGGQLKSKILAHFQQCRVEAEAKLEKTENSERLALHKSLKLEAIESAPVGIAVFCEPPCDESYTLGASTNKKVFEWSVACAIQNMWLVLTARGYGMGWVSILKSAEFSRILEVPTHWVPMGYLCIGKPATDYDGKPMLDHLGWKKQSIAPKLIRR